MKTARVKRTSTELIITQPRLPVVGRINPGIQVLTKAAIQNIDNAQQIYDQGVEAGASFDDIVATLQQANQKYARRPLVPKNVPYFRVTQSDFAAPEAASRIMDLYGEDRGDGNGMQLYSFPVILPSDDINVFFQESFKAWKRNELFRWSTETPDGLKCTKKVDIEQNKSRRRHWGQRPEEFERDCDPNDCQIFNANECKHYGRLYFWIPGITGAGLIELAFTSVYASLGIAEIVEVVHEGLGRVKGTLNGKPIFTISKTLESVSRVDYEQGSATRQQQYIIRMDASGIDMGEIMAQQELGAPTERLALSGPQSFPDDEKIELDAEYDEAVEPAIEPEPEVEPDTEDKACEPELVQSEISQLRSTLWGIIKTFDPPWTADDLQEWLTGNRYGKDAVHNIETLREIIGKMNALNDTEKDPF